MRRNWLELGHSSDIYVANPEAVSESSDPLAQKLGVEVGSEGSFGGGRTTVIHPNGPRGRSVGYRPTKYSSYGSNSQPRRAQVVLPASRQDMRRQHTLIQHATKSSRFGEVPILMRRNRRGCP
ncbi:hypothetical protein FA13DRAFT_1106172 [Coprinellus micaceus]|uniref:Uncharacterized protein n=1 Tax=Coprinellus micaceus TaxID=71717 RepID=A0A4Y7RKE8_COPMI|nr:hypothetical protein FA13DRAFT_1106172 [Coprinellus micaceus]